VSRTITIVAIMALALPAAASAGIRTIAPPGESAVSEYVESVPTAKGQSPTSSLGSQAGALTPSQTAALDRSGAEGRTLAAVVDATSPSPVAAPARTAGRGNAAAGGRAQSLPPGDGSRSPVDSVASAALGGGGGMGLLLPALMLAAVLVTAVGLFRRRRTPPS